MDFPEIHKLVNTKLAAIRSDCAGWQKCQDGSYEMALAAQGYDALAKELRALDELRLERDTHALRRMEAEAALAKELRVLIYRAGQELICKEDGARVKVVYGNDPGEMLRMADGRITIGWSDTTFGVYTPEQVKELFDTVPEAPKPAMPPEPLADYASTTMALIEDYAKAVHDGDDNACVVLRRTIQASLEQPAAQPVAIPAYITEEMWGGLARDIIMWMDMHSGRDMTPRNLFKHLERLGREVPQWLRDEPEMKSLDHVPSKGTRAVIIYKAMLNATPPTPASTAPLVSLLEDWLNSFAGDIEGGEHDELVEATRAVIAMSKGIDISPEAITPASTASADIERDAALLDYLQKAGATIELIPGEGDFYPMRFRVGGLIHSANTDVRKAIAYAAAIAKEQP